MRRRFFVAVGIKKRPNPIELLMSGFMDGHTQWMDGDGNEDEVHEDNNTLDR
jgi:hypothetical protein